MCLIHMFHRNKQHISCKGSGYRLNHSLCFLRRCGLVDITNQLCYVCVIVSEEKTRGVWARANDDVLS